VLSDGNLDTAARQRAFRALLRRGFDLPTVGRFVLGRYWRQADEAERWEFLHLFEDYIVATYSVRLGNYAGDMLKIAGYRGEADGDAIVASRISRPDGPAVRVDWRLRRHGDAWQVIDIVVEGVSLAVAQRTEFASVIRNSGGRVAGLISQLRRKTAALDRQRMVAQ
jgi:phospholipid transport system substrate-binding protein